MTAQDRIEELEHELENVWKPAAAMNEHYARGFEYERNAAQDDLAGHKAALKVATDALKVYARMGYPGAKDALQQIDTLLKP